MRATTAAMSISERFVAGTAGDTSSMSRRLRRRFGFTGTGFAHPITGTCANAPSAGRMIDPNGSMCGIGLSVRRPARLAVSSPNQSATTPCEISCRMMDATSATKKTIVSRATGRGVRSATRRGALNAEPRCGHGCEAVLADRLSAPLARSVGALVDLLERVGDVAEGFPQRPGERVVLAPVRGHLTRVSEAFVEGAAIDAQRRELAREAFALGGKHRARAGSGRFGHGEDGTAGNRPAVRPGRTLRRGDWT